MLVRGSLCLLTLALAMAVGFAHYAAPAEARGCSLAGKERSLGPTYTTSLSVRHTSCSTGYRVVRAFDRCRKHHGKAGHCRHRVLHYRCSERRFDKISTQYDSRVSCRRGSRRVNFTYTQFT
jgi:hypothetical protein